MPTSSSDSNAARAWVAMRLVDGLRQGGLNARYDGHNVKANGEHIDLASVVSAVTSKPHDQWADVVNTFAASVANRPTASSHSAPLGKLGRGHTGTLTGTLAGSPGLTRTIQQPPRNVTPTATSLAGALELRPIDEVQTISTDEVQTIATPVIDLTIAIEHQANVASPESAEEQPTAAREPEVRPETLAVALASMELRVVSNELADGVPDEAKAASPLPDTFTALSVGDGWVTDDDLVSWGIDRDMATDVVQSRIGGFSSPSVELVAATQNSLFILETETRQIATTVCHLDQHIPVRADKGAWVALGGERVAIVALDERLTSAAVNLMIDSAIAECARSTSRLRPALYRWAIGELTLEVPDLDTAAGRMNARAILSEDVSKGETSSAELILL